MFSKLLNAGMLLAVDLAATADKVYEVLHNIVGPCLTALEGCAIIYIVILGVQYAKSENADKRTEAKKRIVNLAIGVVAIGVMITLCFAIKWDKLIPEMFGYLEGSSGSSGSGGGASASTDSKPGNNTYETLKTIRMLLFR